jgi:hypothetical protein
MALNAPIAYNFHLKGLTSLLMHHDSIEGADELEQWRKDPRNKGVSRPGDDRTPPWTWMMHCCNDGKNIALPWEYIAKCCCVAGAKLSLSGKKTFKSATQSGIHWDQEFFDFLVCGKKVPWAAIERLRTEDRTYAEQVKAVRELGFDLLAKRAGVNGKKHVRVRAKFENWEVNGQLQVTMPELNEEVMQQLFSLAGQHAGLGDWRPSAPKAPGPHGMFTAVVERVR